MSDDIFYIYQHRKKDSKEIFYVGKGKKFRHLEESNRNTYWHNIVNKHGFFSEILFDGLNEELSLLIEQELIDKYKKLNISLCNLTAGGEGVSGFKHSDEVKKLISTQSKGRKHNELAKEKIGNYWRGKKRESFSEEHRKKIALKRQKQIMKPLTEEVKNIISLKNTGKKRTPEQRKKISEATKLALLKLKGL
jgi:hypothetical protein